MEPRTNASGYIVRKCCRCPRWGRIAWYKRKKGYEQMVPFRLWESLCIGCWLDRMLSELPAPSNAIQRWENEGGFIETF